MDAKQVLALIKEKDVKFVDFRFTDPRGKWQHTARMASATDEDTFTDGVMFDGSSIAGWKAINESDMILMPDTSTAVLDPFAAQTTLIVNCDVVEPSTGQLYSRCPRSTAKRAEAFMKSSGIGDTAVFGPELEFFVFDDVRFDVQMQGNFYKVTSSESPWNTGAEFEGGNMAHRPGVKGGYFPVQPVDSHNDLRAEMMSVCTDMGITMEIHHHEVAPAQNELGFRFDTLVKTADNVQKYKYTLHNVAHSYGKTLTFMPKPIYGDNGSGMHTHQSIWKDGKPLFAGSGYADLSETALYYIGGIIKHAKGVIPGFEAPVLLAYSSRNRSASCRIPYASSPKGKRVEVRFPDPSANPYLAFAAMLMAGIDGINNKIHPGDPMDKNLYDLPPEELSKVPTVAGSLREALNALDADRTFLTKGGVFTDDQIDAYMELKWEEVYNWEHHPAPIEYKMYYSI
jgi:glutamine synthetase